MPRLTTGEDPQTYGETAYLDAELLEFLNMRINKGRFVAIDKARNNPQLWEIVSDRKILGDLLQNREREEHVLQKALSTATAYGLDQSIAELVFRWVIDQTLELEVEYLQAIARHYPELAFDPPRTGSGTS